MHRQLLAIALMALVSCCLFPTCVVAQVEAYADTLPEKSKIDQFSSSANKTLTHLNTKVSTQNARLFAMLERQQRLAETYINQAKDTSEVYKTIARLRSKLVFIQQIDKDVQPSSTKVYIPNVDSFISIARFLEPIEGSDKLKTMLNNAQSLQRSFELSEQINELGDEYNKLMSSWLHDHRLLKKLKKQYKKLYYFKEKINSYKEALSDLTKAQREVLNVLRHSKRFRDFMQKHSQLSMLFRSPDEPMSMQFMAGLQTRAQVNNTLQQQFLTGNPAARQQLSQSLRQAQEELSVLKQKINNVKLSNCNELQDFKPNTQRSKSFLQRLELGTNVQAQKATSLFPTRTDIGLSVGYKLNDKSIIGIGMSYSLGLGRGWKQIKITHEGMGIRSFIDWKLKGSLYLSGGYEKMYNASFSRIAELKSLSRWQTSGLIGVSKSVPVNNKFFRHTKVQFLWNFLSQQQIPKTQPILIRFGYLF